MHPEDTNKTASQVLPYAEAQSADIINKISLASVMDPVALGAVAYGAETAVEAGVATYFLTQATLPLKARLQHIASPQSIPRSSHSLAVVGDKAYILGGQSSLSEPITNDILGLHIATPDNPATEVRTITAIGEDGSVPKARVHHTAVVARNLIFVFGGQSHSPSSSGTLEENGRLWVFDPRDSKWLFLDPPPHTSFPCGRYSHAMTASPNGSAIFVHAGCVSSGDTLLSDTWGFYFDEGKWTRLADAPGPARVGASIACSGGALWRYGGWDGEKVLGGLESFELPKSQSVDHPGVLDLEKREWSAVSPVPKKDGKPSLAPDARSNAALHFVTTGSGRDYLIIALGEGDPQPDSDPKGTSLLQDIWAYQLPTSGTSGAGLKDAIRNKVPGVKSHECEWAPVEVVKIEIGENEKGAGTWSGRKLFGSSMTGTKLFMLWGGVDALGEVKGDGWVVKIQ